MPIPPLDRHGLLPVGVYDCSWHEVENEFCWNPHRQSLFDKLQMFLAQKWAPLNLVAPLWVNGSFTRRKDQPDDIDVVADVSHLPAIEAYPVLLLQFQREDNKRDFSVDFWVKHPLIPNDLTAFFQYTGLKAGAELRLDAMNPKGILRIVI